MKQAQRISLGLALPADAQPIASMSRELIESGLPWTWTPERVARNLHQAETVVLAARDAGRSVAGPVRHLGPAWQQPPERARLHRRHDLPGHHHR
jgi:hypothetical protein